MEVPNLQQENNELKSRLRAFAAILRLNRDAFSFPDMVSTAVHIVNNSKSLLAYERSSLVETRGRGKVIAEFSQTEVNQHTEYAQSLRRLCKEIKLEDAPVSVTSAAMPEGKLSGAGKRAWEMLTADGMQLIFAPLRSNSYKESKKYPYVWVLEYKEKIPPHVPATLTLIVPDYGSALWLHVPRSGIRSMFRWLSKITFTRIFCLLVIAFLISLFTVELEHTVSAEFVVKPQSAFTSYAWFDCVVRKCHFKDGAKVRKGDTILTYDTDRMRFQLAAAKATFKEADAEYEQESKAAFTDRERLGRLKILKHKREQAQIAITEALWYLNHSTVTAPVDGMLTLAEGSADKLSGRALRTGEKQFDIFTGDGMIAEIHVNEKDASVLEKQPQILLFLHTRPELPIHVKLLSARYYPELTEQNIYCYNLKVEMADNVPGLRYGMRGVARVTGEKVKLGYYLFRSLVLWYRGL